MKKKLLTVVDGFVIDHESTVGMFQSSVGSKDGVVRLNDSSRDLRGRIDSKLELGFLSVVYREAFHQQRGKAGSSASTKRMEDEESLEASALIGKFADTI